MAQILHDFESIDIEPAYFLFDGQKALSKLFDICLEMFLVAILMSCLFNIGYNQLQNILVLMSSDII